MYFHFLLPRSPLYGLLYQIKYLRGTGQFLTIPNKNFQINCLAEDISQFDIKNYIQNDNLSIR